MKVIIEKEIEEETWRMSDLLKTLGGCSKDQIDNAIIDLLKEDMVEVIDNSTWTIELNKWEKNIIDKADKEEAEKDKNG